MEIDTGTITTNGTQTGLSVDLSASDITTAGTVYGINVTGRSSETVGTISGINIGSITGAGATETAINIGTGWDSSITALGLAGNNAALYVTKTTGVFAVDTTDTAGECLVSDGGGVDVPGWGSCVGSTPTLQQVYEASTAPATISLTTANDGLIFTNPTSSGTDSDFLLHLNQANTTDTLSALDITQASNAFDAVNLTANAIDTEKALDISATALTTGTALQITGGTALTTAGTNTGSLLNLSGASFTTAAAGISQLASLSLTNTSSNTSGSSEVRGLNIFSNFNTTGASGLKTTTALNIEEPTTTTCTNGGCTYKGVQVDTFSYTQSIADTFTYTGLAVDNTSGRTLTLQTDASAAITWTGAKINVPTVSKAATSGTATVKGIQVTNGTYTNSSSNTATYYGIHSTSGSTVTQDTNSGTINYHSFGAAMPVIAQTTGTITSNGYYAATGNMTNGTQNGFEAALTGTTITTGGTLRGLQITSPTSGQSVGTIQGINISNLTAGAATETAIAIGTGWDTALTASSGNVTAASRDLLDLTLGTIATSGTLQAIDIAIGTPGAGTANGINIQNITGGAGAVNGINIGTMTGGAGAEYALAIGAGWDTDINATTSLEVGIGGTNELILDGTNLTPGLAEGNSLGSATFEWEKLFLGDAAGIAFGTGQEVSEFFDTTDDVQNYSTALTASANTDYGLYTLAADNANATMTADQEIFEIGKGGHNDSDAAYTELFSVDEDGDVVIAGQLSFGSCPSCGGTTRWNNIGDADGLGSVDFSGFDQDIVSAEDAGDMLTMTNTTADLTSDTTILRLAFNDTNDANGFFIKGTNDEDGTPVNDWIVANTGTAGGLTQTLGSSGVRLTTDGDGALTLLGLGDGSDEDLTINLDDTSDSIVLSSSTSATNFTLSGFTDFDCSDCIDFDDLSNSLSLDEATTITNGLAGGNDLSIDLTSGGDFTIKDSGITIATFFDNGQIHFQPANNTEVTLALGTGSSLELTSSVARATDLAMFQSTGATIDNNIDGLFIDFRTGDGTNPVNSGINVSLTSGGTATGASGDRLYGLNFALSGTSGQEHGINFADNNFDVDINATTSLEVGIGGTNELILDGTNFTPGGAELNSLGSATVEWEQLFLGNGNGIAFGTGQEMSEFYDTTDDVLNFSTALTASANTDYGLYTLAADNANATMTADQEIFEIGKGGHNDSDAAYTELFSVDEDGDVVIAGQLSFGTCPSCGGTTAWNDIGDPTTTTVIDFADGEITTFNNSSDTEAIWTMNANSLTTGQLLSLAHTTSVIANGGSLLKLSSTSADTGTTTGNLLDLSSSGSTVGSIANIALSNASQTATTALTIAQTGVTTGYTGSLINVSSTSTTGAATFFNLAANSSTVGTLAALSGDALTTGVGLAIDNGTSAMTTGSLLRVTAGGTGAIATNGIVGITHAGAYTSTSNAGLLNVTASGLVGTGTVVNIGASNASQLTDTLLNVAQTGVTTGYTGTMINLSSTSTTGAATFLSLAADASTVGTLAALSGDALTTGIGLAIDNGTSAMTTGSLLRVTAGGTGAIATNGIVGITHAGAFTSTSNAGLLNVSATGLTGTGTVVNIAASNSSQATDTLLNVAQTGVTTGYTGTMINLSSTSTTGAATFLSLAANSSTVGTLAALSGDALTTGVGLAIDNGTSAMTTGSLLRVTAGGTGAIATNGIVGITHAGAYTSTSNAGLLNVTASGLVGTGTVVNIGASNASQLTDTLLNVAQTGVTTGYTGTMVGLSSTSTTGAATFFSLAADASTVGTLAALSGDALTTGVGLQLDNGTSAMTSGSLIKVNASGTGAIATNGIVSFNHAGAFTSTSNVGFVNINASATTAGTVQSIFADALTTGTGLYGSFDALTTGSAFSINSTSTVLADTADTGGGLLGEFNWDPGSTANGTGDLFRIRIDGNGTLTSGSLFNIVDESSSIFSVKETVFETSLPTSFTAAGDMSVAYDIMFTNPTASYIKSAAPMAIVAGETFNSSDLTLATYNSGDIVLDPASTGAVKADGVFAYNNLITLANDATPDVSGGNWFVTGGTTTITDFDAGSGTLEDGHVIFVKVAHSLTMTCTGTEIDCGAADLSLTDNDMISFIYDSTEDIWWLNNWFNDADTQSGGDDLAEWHVSTENLQPGDIVAIDENENVKIHKTNGAYDQKTMGIVATQPGLILGSNKGVNSYLVALQGYVPTKVSTENGPIQRGDYLTASSVPGVAMKATRPGQVIGKAFQPFSGSGVGTIEVFVNVSYADPGYKVASVFEQEGSFEFELAENGTLAVNNGNSDIFNVDSAGNVVLGASDLTTTSTDGFGYISSLDGRPTAAPTSINGHTAITYDKLNNQICAYNGGWNCIGASDNDAAAALSLDEEGALVVPDLKANKITVSGDVIIGGLASAAGFALDSNTINMTGALATLPVNSEGKVTLADIVNSLNSQISQTTQDLSTLESQQASQSAELAEARILGEQAVSHALTLDDKVASTSSSLSSLSDRISDLLASISGDSNPSTPSASPNPSEDSDLTPPDVMFATGSATLANINITEKTSTLNLEAIDATISATFKSLGETFLGQTTIAGDLTVDGTLSFTNGNSINAFPILYIQNNPLAQAVDFFNGLVTISKDGVLTAKEIVVDQIKVTADTSAGTVIIPAGELEIPVLNALVKTDSIIILTSETPGAPNLSVSAKVEESGFIVTLNAPFLDDVQFSYLIVGQKEAAN